MKYEIEFIYKDDTREKLIGSGIPTQNEEEYLIKSPDGVEIVRRKENIVGFNIREYKG